MSSRAGAGTVVRPRPTSVPERILVAAEQCAARLGLSRLSMTDVASQAGVSRGAVYLHFADRRALVDAVLSRAAARFVAGSADSVRRRHTLEAQVAEAAAFIRAHLGDSVLTLRLPADEESLFATLLTTRLEGLLGEWVEFWLPFLAEAEKRGELRAGVDHRQAAEWIVRMMLSFAVMPAVSFDGDRPEQVRAFVRAFIVNGLGPIPAEKGSRA
ncbi:MAG TPA: TetR/AcrR family transcriptional regulator [Acidimicrobiales bacterium]|nr:TetR/AcrR family transcriptional regulator [Acidimicrobiales bacterium]